MPRDQPRIEIRVSEKLEGEERVDQDITGEEKPGIIYSSTFCQIY